jgi:hypothetical protein
MLLTKETSIVEIVYQVGAYGFAVRSAIIDHPQHGRLLIAEGWGTAGGLGGEMYRWLNGLCVKLRPGDTFASLRAGRWNEGCSLLDAVLHGVDYTRPMQTWDGREIDTMAERLGL